MIFPGYKGYNTRKHLKDRREDADSADVKSIYFFQQVRLIACYFVVITDNITYHTVMDILSDYGFKQCVL